MLLDLLEVVRRCDRIELAPVRKTDEGFLIVEGFIARPGVYEYHVDGQIIRELVLPEDLHDPASIETLKRKPMTLGHPRKDVSPGNVKQHRVGSIGENVTIEPDGRLKISFTIERADAIKAVEAGTHQLSPGYKVSIERSSGIHPEFGRYDAIQRRRRYNHGAIVDRARGGPEIHLRADEAYSLDRGVKLGAPMLKFIALLLASGVSREDADVIGPQCEVEAESRVDAATTTLKADVLTLTGERDAQKSRADSAEADVPDPLEARLDWFGARTDLMGLAVKHDVADCDKLDNDAIALAVVRKLDDSVAEDADPKYVAAYLAIHKDAADKVKRPGANLYGGSDKRGDAFPDDKDPNKKDPVDAHFDAIEEARREKMKLPTGDKI